MQQQISFLDLLSGRTFQEPSAVTAEPISPQSLRRFAESKGTMFLFLNLQGGVEAGRTCRGRWVQRCVAGI